MVTNAQHHAASWLRRHSDSRDYVGVTNRDCALKMVHDLVKVKVNGQSQTVKVKRSKSNGQSSTKSKLVKAKENMLGVLESRPCLADGP